MRSGIEATVSSLIDGLCRGELGNCFAPGECTVTPERIINEKLVLICDFDVKRYELVGRQANAIIKYFFQKAVERRKEKDCFVFIYADEAQFFATQYDQKFQTTARSSRCITAYATQNLPNYFAEIGQNRTMALLGNMQTKIFCQNSDVETNRWAADIIGKTISTQRSRSLHYNGLAYRLDESSPLRAVSSNTTESETERKDYIVSSEEFLALRMGDSEELCRVDAIIVSPSISKFWKQHIKLSPCHFLRLRFYQPCEGRCGLSMGVGASEPCERRLQLETALTFTEREEISNRLQHIFSYDFDHHVLQLLDNKCDELTRKFMEELVFQKLKPVYDQKLADELARLSEK